MYNLWSDDLLHTADTYCDSLKTVGDLHSFSVGLWVCQLGAHVWSSVTCWCICPVCVLLFCILNNREFRDSFFLNDRQVAVRAKAFILLPRLLFTVFHLSTICRFWYMED